WLRVPYLDSGPTVTPSLASQRFLEKQRRRRHWGSLQQPLKLASSLSRSPFPCCRLSVDHLSLFALTPIPSKTDARILLPPAAHPSMGHAKLVLVYHKNVKMPAKSREG